MFVGSRNFDVSESGEEPYLNEPGGMNLPTHLGLIRRGGEGGERGLEKDTAHKNAVTTRPLIESRSRVTKIFLRKERGQSGDKST